MKRVLIVDDSIDLARLLQDALRTAHPDIPVIIVPSAEEALLESTRFTIDLLVTDWRLPGMSGIELIRKIRVRQPNTKVILITGLSMDDRLGKQRDEAAPDVFIRKPILPAAFIAAANQFIGDSAATEKLQPEKTAAKPENPPAKVDHEAVQGVPLHEAGLSPAVLEEISSVLPGEPVTQPAPTRKGTGLLKLPPVELPAAPAEEGLSSILSRLRGSLNAVVTMLLDERGRPVAQAGDLPELALEGQLVPPMMASLSAGAKISYLLGQASSQSVQAYRGTAYELVFAPVGQYVLLFVLRASRSALRMALAFEEALSAQTELAGALESMGLHIQSAVEAGAPEVMLAEMGVTGSPEEEIPAEILETPLGQDPGLEKFEELFSGIKSGDLQPQDLDAFWDTAHSGDQNEMTQPGVLSFDQAQKLGLLPPDATE